MPSPVGHALAGLTVYALCVRRSGERPSVRGALPAVAAALLPDADLVLNVLVGPGHHRAESHSVGMAALAGLAVAALARLGRRRDAGRLGVLVGLSWLSHVLLDWLGRDTNPPIGLMALWPFSHGWYASPVPLFLDIGRTLEWDTVRNNALAATWECLLLVPVLWLAARPREEHDSGARF